MVQEEWPKTVQRKKRRTKLAKKTTENDRTRKKLHERTTFRFRSSFLTNLPSLPCALSRSPSSRMSRQDAAEVGGSPALEPSKGISSPVSMANVAYGIPSTAASVSPSPFLGLAERLAGRRAASVTVNGVSIPREGAPSSDDLPSEFDPVQKKAKFETAGVVEKHPASSSPDSGVGKQAQSPTLSPIKGLGFSQVSSLGSPSPLREGIQETQGTILPLTSPSADKEEEQSSETEVESPFVFSNPVSSLALFRQVACTASHRAALGLAHQADTSVEQHDDLLSSLPEPDRI